MRPLTPFLAAALTVVVAIVAIAAPRVHTDTNDPNDTRGVLDVRRVRLAHQTGTEVTVLTFAKWAPPAIWDRGNAYVFFDTQGGPEAEYFILVRSMGTKLHASLWRERAARREPLFHPQDNLKRRLPDRILEDDEDPLASLEVLGSLEGAEAEPLEDLEELEVEADLAG